MGNAAVGAINEAQWKAAQPSINKQINTAIDNIWGDDGAGTSGTSSGADRYAGLWTASFLGDGAFADAAGTTAGSPANDNYDLIATNESPEGYPVPVTNTNDPAILDALYKNTTAFVNYERSQGLYGDLPPVPQPWDSQGLIGFNHALQQMVWPGSGLQTLSAVNVVGMSEMQQDVAAANAAQADTETALSSLQGSVGGDIAYSGLTLLTRGLLDLGVAAESVADIVTDRQSANQAVTGFGNMLWDVGSAVVHPVQTYNHLVNGMTNWFEESPNQQAQDIGRFGIDTLLSFGAEGVAAKGLDYVGTLAGKLGAAWDALDAGPAIGSPLAQAGKLDIGAFTASSSPVLDGEFTAVRFGDNGEVYAKLPAPSNPDVLRWQRMNPDGLSNREMYMGSTPSKDSAIGLQVQDQMRLSGDLVGEGADRMVLGSDGNWYPIAQTDMGHVQAAVDFWNTEGRFYGPRSPEVRDFMTDPSNYWLEPSSINRSNGASMGKTYLLPAAPAEQAQFFGIDDIY